ncbi:hypothetical protein QP943_00275 [Corynebacterium kefirresidentii]|uniref:Uncharacterized protein n=1 Tax=Corynebacterium kefirresidentii TaxID=1979527 RepID=A0ABT8Q2E3_9CORY|nr:MULTISPECIES: hypothetical protein [Corynebacterium]WKS54251.1 hypothetical protein NLL48_03625 [Corynebacterium tuberculostearicum]ERS46888.1 hypothetical protein HMPREF1282_01551 [Corynebacterium sp. KPL1856]ERS47735.1 hypothetical protein HMPREF1286_01876 [Corynebacterium sp. KPL1860]ERS57150.1 hypothetical protein HMPREF1264_00056 [Corynebacterium sp. KPL1821]ERS62606.1 hypothetical protein HMPREF1260_00797 [Corynebacterium sp. KPL1817]
MNTRQMIPFMWLRLLIVIGFTIFVAVQHMWVIVAISACLALLTIWQLWSAYRNR